jgi:hypothetical protein
MEANLWRSEDASEVADLCHLDRAEVSVQNDTEIDATNGVLLSGLDIRPSANARPSLRPARRRMLLNTKDRLGPIIQMPSAFSWEDHPGCGRKLISFALRAVG